MTFGGLFSGRFPRAFARVPIGPLPSFAAIGAAEAAENRQNLTPISRGAIASSGAGNGGQILISRGHFGQSAPFLSLFRLNFGGLYPRRLAAAKTAAKTGKK